MDENHIKAILFDLDGVLVDSYPAWFHLLNAAAKEFSYPEISEEQYAKAWGQSVEDDIKHFFPGLSPQVLAQYFDDHFFDFTEYIRVNPVAGDVLREVREMGFGTAIITNTPTALAQDILARGHLSLDYVIGNGDVENDKPYPDMVIEACRRLNVRTDQAVVIGDSDFDKAAAESAGSLFIGFGRNEKLAIDDLKDLTTLLESMRTHSSSKVINNRSRNGYQ